jgi:hypothetical protein
VHSCSSSAKRSELGRHDNKLGLERVVAAAPCLARHKVWADGWSHVEQYHSCDCLSEGPHVASIAKTPQFDTVDEHAFAALPVTEGSDQVGTWPLHERPTMSQLRWNGGDSYPSGSHSGLRWGLA